MNLVRLNTAFIPPKEVSEKTIELSKTITNLAETYFVLDGLDFHPHITIYPPEYPEENISKVLEAIEKTAKSISPVEFQYKRVESHQGYIGIEFEKSSQIQMIHEVIVNTLNPLRERHIREKYKDYQFKFSAEQIENIQEYGYEDAMNLYNPHLTIIRLKNETKAKEIAHSIQWNTPEFIADKIGIYKTGDSGTARELVKEFNLDGYNS